MSWVRQSLLGEEWEGRWHKAEHTGHDGLKQSVQEIQSNYLLIDVCSDVPCNPQCHSPVSWEVRERLDRVTESMERCPCKYLCLQSSCCSPCAYLACKALAVFLHELLVLFFCLKSSHPAHKAWAYRPKYQAVWGMELLDQGFERCLLREEDWVLNCCPSMAAFLELWISLLQSTRLHGIPDSSVTKSKWPWFELPPSLPLVARKPLFQPTEQQFNPTPSPSTTASVSGNSRVSY